MTPTFSPVNLPTRLGEDASTATMQVQRLTQCCARHIETIGRDHGNRLKSLFSEAGALNGSLSDAASKGVLADQAAEYVLDAVQRLVLTLDTIRERGDNDIKHQAAGTPPALIYQTEVAVDGHTLPRPVNYVLLKIIPPDGVAVFDWKRPYMIIDPRAGHGAGIGGFNTDSQVGVALHDGHPVYFVVFRPHPEPNQTLLGDEDRGLDQYQQDLLVVGFRGVGRQSLEERNL